MIPFEQQIKYLLDKYFDEILEYIQRDKNDSISDVDDGLVFQEISKAYPDAMILSFTINTDGAQMYKSNNSSLWPIQINANFLPPQLRFKRDNILVYSLYLGRHKPD